MCFSDVMFLLPFILFTPGTAGQSTSVTGGFPTNDCGINWGCIGFPDDSCLAIGRCSILLKFSFDSSDPDHVPVELYGTPPGFRPQNFWIAAGFNPESGRMSGALVTECVYNNGGAGVFSSRNARDGYMNSRLPNLSGVVPGNATLHGGILGCSFTLDRVRIVEGETYDLGQPLYIVAGNGPAVGSTIRQHFQRPYISPDAIVIAPQGNFAATTTPLSASRPVLFDKFLQNPFTESMPPRRITSSTTIAPPRQALRTSVFPRPPRPSRFHDTATANDASGISDDSGAISHTKVAQMIMRFIEPPLRMIVDLLNRGVIPKQ